MIPPHLADPRHLSPVTHPTPGGVVVARTAERLAGDGAFDALIGALDTRRGLVLSSGVEAPGRYRRFRLGFVDPPLAVTARG
ncbi:MAG TPA: anthranilate synthase component I, partial [Azospirillum sp.]